MIILDQQEITLQQLKEKLKFPQELFRHCGSILIDNTVSHSRMMVCFHEEAGYYLNYSKQDSQDEWLSLADINLLDKVIEYDVDCHASLGLFLSLGDAIAAIVEFALSGERSSLVSWISATQMPEDSNW